MKFTETLVDLTYSHTPPVTNCELFVQLMSALNCNDRPDVVITCTAIGVAGNHSLKKLDLSENYITNASSAVHIFKSVQNNTSLEELVLSHTVFQQANDSESPRLSNAIEEMLNDN